MTIPDYQTLMLPLLKRAADAEIGVPKIREGIADEFGLAIEERDQLLKSGTQRVLDNRLHWAKIYLSKAGLLVTPSRGRFIATEQGRVLLAQNPARIDNELLARYPSFLEFVNGRATSAANGKVEPKDAVSLVEATATP